MPHQYRNEQRVYAITHFTILSGVAWFGWDNSNHKKEPIIFTKHSFNQSKEYLQSTLSKKNPTIPHYYIGMTWFGWDNPNHKKEPIIFTELSFN